MLHLFFLTIILYIIIQHLMEETEDIKIKTIKKKIQPQEIKKLVKENSIKKLFVSVSPSQSPNNYSKANDNTGTVIINQQPKIFSEGRLINNKNVSNTEIKSQIKEVVFDKPNPWSKIIFDPTKEYPYFFYIKVNIPSLNDFQNWKSIVPNLEFDPRSGELIIPSQHEPSAIALANLILINFSGQISLKDILDKNLIGISISKAKSFEHVLNKLREQIMENLHGKKSNISLTNFEKDLAQKPESFVDTNLNNQKIDFKSDNFTDTFEHFTDNNNKDDLEAWDGNDFSYL